MGDAKEGNNSWAGGGGCESFTVIDTFDMQRGEKAGKKGWESLGHWMPSFRVSTYLFYQWGAD